MQAASFCIEHLQWWANFRNQVASKWISKLEKLSLATSAVKSSENMLTNFISHPAAARVSQSRKTWQCQRCHSSMKYQQSRYTDNWSLYTVYISFLPFFVRSSKLSSGSSPNYCIIFIILHPIFLRSELSGTALKQWWDKVLRIGFQMIWFGHCAQSRVEAIFASITKPDSLVVGAQFCPV